MVGLELNLIHPLDATTQKLSLAVALRVWHALLALIMVFPMQFRIINAFHVLQESTPRTETLSASPVCRVDFPVHLVLPVYCVQQELFHMQVAHSAKCVQQDLHHLRLVQAYAQSVLPANIL